MSMKKLLSLILAALLSFSFLAGCGQQGGSETSATPTSSELPQSQTSEQTTAEPSGSTIEFPQSEDAQITFINEYSLPLAEEKQTLTFMRTGAKLMGPMEALNIQNLHDFKYDQYLEEITNVHIDYYELEYFSASEKMLLAINSGDYSDMILNLTYPGGDAAAYEAEIILDLTGYISESAPNYQHILDSNAQLSKESHMDGMLLNFQAPYDDFRDNQGLVVRSDWLSDLGLQAPETYDELYDVLMAFKNEKGASIPIYMNNDCTINDLMEGFNIQTYSASGTATTNASGTTTTLPFYVEGGVVKCTLDQDAYREYLQMMNQWYQDGLFDPDFISVRFDPFDSYLSGNIQAGEMGVWPTSVEGIDNYDPVPITPIASPVQNKGDMNHITEKSLLIDTYKTYITTQCKDVDLAVRWMDYWYSVDGTLLYNYGLEGDTYEIVDSEPVFTDIVINNEFGVSPSNYMRGFSPFGVFSGVLLRYRTAEFNSDNASLAWDVWTNNLDATMAMPSQMSLSVEESEGIGALYGDLSTYAMEMIPRFIIGDIGFDQWETYVTELNKLGLQECVAFQQQAYDRYIG